MSIAEFVEIVAINNGYYNYKGEYDIIYPSRLMVAPFDEVITTNDKLKYEGITYIVGDGEPLLEMEKDKGDFTRILVLNMLARIMNKTKKKKSSFKVLLSAPPLMHFKNNDGGNLIEYLKGEYKIIWNTKELEINIVDVVILPETFVAFPSINTNGRFDSGDVYIFDIGGYATNIARIQNGNFSQNDFVTVLNGMYHIDSSIAQHLNQRYSKYNQNCNYKDIENYRKNGLYFDQEGRKTNFYLAERDKIEEIAKTHFNELMTECKTKKWNLSSGRVVIIGGGGEGMYEIIKKHYFQTAILSENPIWENFLGLCQLKEVVFGED